MILGVPVLEWSAYDPFATPEDYATFAQRDLSDVEAGTVTLLLASASARIRSFCRWQVWPIETDDALECNGTGAREMVLPVRKLIDLTNIAEDGTDLDPDAYTWTRMGTIKRVDGARWTDRDRGLIVTASHGFEASQIGRASCSVQPVVVAEVPEGEARDPVASRWQVFAPPAADVRATDRIVFDGDVYEVDGEPQRWTTGVLDHVEFFMAKVVD
jgi:hypothetical protein